MAATKVQTFQLRPFYFGLVVWGEQYRDYFLEYCLPSLLAPGNIPAITGIRPAKLLIATTATDWDAIRRTTIFHELQRHIPAVFLELPPHPPERHYWYQAVLGHKLCCELISQDKAYRFFTSPDTVVSDGTIVQLHHLALDGAQAVLKLTAPLMQKDLFIKTLGHMGMLPKNSARDTGRPLIFAPRQLTELAFSAMHGVSRINEWATPNFCGYAATPWWRVPGDLGAVINGNFWDVLLVDYSAVRHDGSLLDMRGWDGDYVMRTIGDLETIYFVRDSDELQIVGWASFAEPALRRHRGGELTKGTAFRRSAYSPVFNNMQRDLLFVPTFVHTEPLNKEWSLVEEDALRIMSTWLDPPVDIERYERRLPAHRRNLAGLNARIAGSSLPWWRRNSFIWRLCRQGFGPIAHYMFNPKLPIPARIRAGWHSVFVISRRIMMLVAGNPAAFDWWKWRLRKAAADVRGRPFLEPRPNAPD